MTAIHTHPLGIFLALVFIVSMGRLFWWMLHVPPAVPYEVAHVTRTIQAVKRILVPVVDSDYARRAIELACRLGAEQKAEIFLLAVLEVPLTSPLGIALPETEARLNEVLKKAAEIVSYHNLPSRTRIIRARTAGTGILQAAAEEEVQLIVIGVRPKRQIGGLGSTSEWLLRRATCELLIDRQPA
ncbi:universal stress protein [Moorella sp. Hama-1]|uniref:universal stress protein n=1 Tax=Moorella sp. Hama-1 TaxID=2138101 RepID=UPI000D648B98|nr:universal stress protein [Moorella sp. Hama-1]MDN5362910.1 hypothetical protein [Moorella sp. (in: firmicutes)]BCV21508.1 hypothetical protein hamaS1_15770 [Moorella sp. Hama-1]